MLPLGLNVTTRIELNSENQKECVFVRMCTFSSAWKALVFSGHDYAANILKFSECKEIALTFPCLGLTTALERNSDFCTGIFSLGCWGQCEGQILHKAEIWMLLYVSAGSHSGHLVYCALLPKKKWGHKQNVVLNGSNNEGSRMPLGS